MRDRGRPRRAQARARHEDDWLLTYADTVTLLLCLFVVLLASRAYKPVPVPIPVPVENPAPSVPVEQPVATANFVDWKQLANPMKLVNETSPDDAEDRTTPPRQEDTLLSAASHDAPTATEQEMEAEPDALPVLAAGSVQPVPKAAATVAPRLASGAAAVPLSGLAVDVTPGGPDRLEQKGEWITRLVFDSAAFFNRGAATLNNAGKVILQDVVGHLKSETYRDYMVTIEGHTDDAVISTTQFPSNWELSAARAAAVARFFIEQGVPAQRLRAAGYADTRPLQPNRDANGVAMQENQARNRRVVIELEKIEHH